MTDRLTEIEQSLVEYETAWSDYEFGQSHFEHGLDSITWLIKEVKRLRIALGAHIQVIGATHANGYGHSNPWDHCDMPICRTARDQRTSESAQG